MARKSSVVDGTNVPQDISDDLQALCLEARDTDRWFHVGWRAQQEVDAGLPKAVADKRVATFAGVESGTAQNWREDAYTIGPDLVAEFPFTYNCWRKMLPAARRRLSGDKRDADAVRLALVEVLATIADKWQRTEGDHGGIVVPPDVIASLDGEPAASEAERYARDVATLGRVAARLLKRSRALGRPGKERGLIETAVAVSTELGRILPAADASAAAAADAAGAALDADCAAELERAA